jgi:hypothetical protein
MEEKDSINKLFNKMGSLARDLSDGFKKLGNIGSDHVLSTLDNIVVKKTQYTSEKNVENIISNQLEIEYKNQVHQQYGIGGFLHLKN